jgi:hypothetical protein
MTRPLHSRRRLAALALATLLLAGCAEEKPENRYSAEGDQAPRSDLLEATPTAWEHADVVDDTHVRVTFEGGTDACPGHDVEVQETAGTVTITLSTGWLPGIDGGCSAQAVEYTTLVETEQPIGDREIVDGTAG